MSKSARGLSVSDTDTLLSFKCPYFLVGTYRAKARYIDEVMTSTLKAPRKYDEQVFHLIICTPSSKISSKI